MVYYRHVPHIAGLIPISSQPASRIMTKHFPEPCRSHLVVYLVAYRQFLRRAVAIAGQLLLSLLPLKPRVD